VFHVRQQINASSKQRATKVYAEVKQKFVMTRVHAQKTFVDRLTEYVSLLRTTRLATITIPAQTMFVPQTAAQTLRQRTALLAMTKTHVRALTPVSMAHALAEEQMRTGYATTLTLALRMIAVSMESASVRHASMGNKKEKSSSITDSTLGPMHLFTGER